MIGFSALNLGRGIGLCGALALGLVLTGATVPAEEAAWTPSADAEAQVLGLEDLVHLKVTSVSSAATRWMDAPAAVYVVTQEDIKRSGATSIQDALRQVPGVQVAQFNASTWAISARGDNSEFADKMLVMVDGRSVYQPLFSGVQWDTQEVVMEDVDRIEVIRGPGATIWGANAVNGIINVITKQTKDTQGGQSVSTVGTDEYSQTGRWGGELPSGKGHYRVYGKAIRRDSFEAQDHSLGTPGPKQGKVGFRTDWDESDQDRLMVSGEGYVGEAGQQGNYLKSMVPHERYDNRDTYDNWGAHVLGRWDQMQSDTSNTTLQAYVDVSNRKGEGHEYDLLVLDLDFKHRIQPTDNNYTTWGAGYRLSSDDSDGSWVAEFHPDSKSMDLFSSFIQNEFRTLDDRLRLTAGAKLEHNEFTGWEVQPSVRFAFLADDDNVFWGAISRAVQTRSRVDDGVIDIGSVGPGEVSPEFPLPPLPEALRIALVGDDNADAERVYAFELGYRSQLREDLSFDLTTFYNRYNHRAAYNAGDPTGNDGKDPYSLFLFAPPSPLLPLGGAGTINSICGCDPFSVPDTGGKAAFAFMGFDPSDYIVLPISLSDTVSVESYGLETSLNWTVTDNWALGFGYSYLKKKDRETHNVMKDNPKHQFNVQSNLNLPYNLELDTYAYYVDDMKENAGGVDSYVRLDFRLGWQASENVELSLVGQNLLEHNHDEWDGTLAAGDQVPRAGYVMMKWDF